MTTPEKSFLGRAFCPEPDTDQGDPFLVEVPESQRGSGPRYLVFVSGPGFPLYGSDDLLDPSGWRRLGDGYPGIGVDPWAWAPCVRYVEGLDRPWVMLYSLALGAGEVDGHRGHRIRRADSLTPTGPFEDSGEVLTPDSDFAIDPELHTGSDGQLRMFYATDFVGDEPYGTGLAQAPISSDLRSLLSDPVVVGRPRADWHVYDAERVIPWKGIVGINWDEGETVRWSTIEGPAILTSPRGRELILYSGGNFAGFYGIGILAATPNGEWTDLSPESAQCLLAPDPEAGLVGPGHCSVLTSAGRTFMAYHFRSGLDELRQFSIVELAWDEATDLPRIN